VSQVALRDNIEGSRVIQDVVIQGEFAAEEMERLTAVIKSDDERGRPWNQIDLGSLKAGPGRLFDIGSDFGQVVGGDLASPVGFDCFFYLTVRTYMKRGRGTSISGD
jgi:hypothetical protein